MLDLFDVLIRYTDGDCTDVTRRYAQAFISKTRKARVTGTPTGEIWWDRVMATLVTGAHPVSFSFLQSIY